MWEWDQDGGPSVGVPQWGSLRVPCCGWCTLMQALDSTVISCLCTPPESSPQIPFEFLRLRGAQRGSVATGLLPETPSERSVGEIPPDSARG